MAKKKKEDDALQAPIVKGDKPIGRYATTRAAGYGKHKDRRRDKYGRWA